MKLYYHQTSGGAKYLFDTYTICPNGHREGRITDKTKYVVRIDGDITKDAELNVREKKSGTTPKKRFKLIYALMCELNIESDGKFSSLMDKLDELAANIDSNHPKALEALCYYEDNILSILSEGMEVKELN